MKKEDIHKLAKGEIIKIEKEKYQILNIYQDVSIKEDKTTDEFIRIELHKLDEKTLHPTNELRIYPNNKIFLVDVVPAGEPPAWVLPRSRRGSWSIKNHKEINPEDISLINS